MIESRLAVAQQLTEMSGIMQSVAEELYDITPAEPGFREKLKKTLKKKHILLRSAWVMDRIEGRRQMFLTMKAGSGQCVSVLEVSQILSGICECAMTSAEDSRSIVNGEYHTVHFVEDVSYQVIYGVARLTREEEKVSGDNYICRQEDNGRFVMCLSDGMGSGMEACRESEVVVELLEQFLESGFSQETASQDGEFSSRYERPRRNVFHRGHLVLWIFIRGYAAFSKPVPCLRLSGETTGWNRSLQESLAAGLMQQMNLETSSRKLYHGDYVIMMTDGVLDALPAGREEETMKEIIMDIREEPPRDIGRGILERVLGYSDYRARDDMTVLRSRPDTEIGYRRGAAGSFMKRQIYGKVRDFVKAEQMFTDVCAVSAAVSGGGDSMAMLDILLRLREEFGFLLRAVHVNHGIRGEAALKGPGTDRKNMQENGIVCAVYSYDVLPFHRKTEPDMRKREGRCAGKHSERKENF